MTPVLRIFLIVCAALMLVFVFRKIRKSQFDTADSLFWLLLSLGLVFSAVFPGVIYFFSDLFGFTAPSNFVFLAVIALLLIREFSLQAEVAKLRRKLTTLVQEIALSSKNDNK